MGIDGSARGLSARPQAIGPYPVPDDAVFGQT